MDNLPVVDVRVLGPVEVRQDGRVVAVGRRRERLLLGLLLLEPGRVISTDRLQDLLWDGDPPATARGQLRANVSRLRARLDPDGSGRNGLRVLSRAGGYVVEIDADAVDAHRFRTLFEQ